jgi:hypothetical protein
MIKMKKEIDVLKEKVKNFDQISRSTRLDLIENKAKVAMNEVHR